jgi:hypothetical protein
LFCLGVRLLLHLHTERRLDYFLRRVNAPTAREPNPRRPSSGSGEAVCGRLAPELLWFALLFCWPEVAFWSVLVVLLGVLLLVALVSAAGGVAVWAAGGVAVWLDVSVLVVELVLEVEDWVASVDDVLDAGALVLGAGEVAPVWALSFAAVPVVELAGALVLGADEVAPVWALSVAAVPVVELAGALVLGAVVSGGFVVVAGVLCVELGVPTFVDDVWSVTGGWPAAFVGLDGAFGAACALGSGVVLVVDCVLDVVDCALGSAGAVVDVWDVELVVVLDVDPVACAKAIAAAKVITIRTTVNFFMRNSCAKDPGSRV